MKPHIELHCDYDRRSGRMYWRCAGMYIWRRSVSDALSDWVEMAAIDAGLAFSIGTY